MSDNYSSAREFLRENVFRMHQKNWGTRDSLWMDQIVSQWFDESVNYDGRFAVLTSKIPVNNLQNMRILDMACGCGTFVLHGLKNGFNVCGIDLELWKLQYVRRKVHECGYPPEWLNRFHVARGENLPYKNQTFDLVTSYQTIEHVQDVTKCLNEMLRVLKPGGILYLRAPSYNTFFEGHYRIFWWPWITKWGAILYLKLLGRPTHGVRGLQFVTARKIIRILKKLEVPIQIQDMNHEEFLKRESLMRLSKIPTAARLYNYYLESKIQLTRAGKKENAISLWIVKT